MLLSRRDGVSINYAFLPGDLHEEIFKEIPQGLEVDSAGLVCKLKKSLYGLKQASRQWYDKLTETLCTKGFIHSTSDYSLFYKVTPSSTVFVAVYVDDIILTGTDFQKIQDLKSFLYLQFKIKDLGRLHYFLGLEIIYQDACLFISQRKFIMDLLKEFDCLGYSPMSSPLDSSAELHAS